jgi:cytochrome P450
MTAGTLIQDRIDLAEPGIQQDPWPLFSDLRARAPVTPIKSEFIRKNAVAVTCYDDVLMVYKDSRFSNDMSANVPRVFRWLMRGSGSFDIMMLKDDPEHRRLRGLVDKAFTPQMVAEMAPRIERITQDLLDEMAKKTRLTW